jgi:hypothetical protein
LHKEAADNDEYFTIELFKEVFGRIVLGTHTRTGTPSFNQQTQRREHINVLDPEKIKYVYDNLCARINAVCSSQKARNKRQNYEVFEGFMKKVIDSSHMYVKRLKKKEENNKVKVVAGKSQQLVDNIAELEENNPNLLNKQDETPMLDTESKENNDDVAEKHDEVI